MILKSEQQRLYALMPPETHSFVRVCDQDSALWVSDLPRRLGDCTETEERLLAEGFSVMLDEKSRLWYVDWTDESWRMVVSELPKKMADFPSNDAYHEIYALCRLYLQHPCECQPDHLAAMRRTLKLTESQLLQMRRGIRLLHEEAASRLREGKTIAHAAGRILAAWLIENRKETHP